MNLLILSQNKYTIIKIQKFKDPFLVDSESLLESAFSPSFQPFQSNQSNSLSSSQISNEPSNSINFNNNVDTEENGEEKITKKVRSRNEQYIFNIINAEIIANEKRKIITSWYDDQANNIYYITNILNSEHKKIYKKSFNEINTDDKGIEVGKLKYDCLLPLRNQIFYRQNGLINIYRLNDNISETNEDITFENKIKYMIKSIDNNWIVIVSSFIKLIECETKNIYIYPLVLDKKISSFNVEVVNNNIIMYGCWSLDKLKKDYKFLINFQNEEIIEKEINGHIINFFDELGKNIQIPKNKTIIQINDDIYLKFNSDYFQIIEIVSKKELLCQKHNFVNLSKMKIYKVPN